MTCREKLKIEYPDKVNNITGCGCYGCPKDYGYLPNPEYCMNFGDEELCTKCWDREIPGTKETKEEKEMKFYTKEELGHMVHSELIDVIIEMQEKCNELAFAIKDDHRILSLDIEQKAEEIKKLKDERDAQKTIISNLNTDLVDCIKKCNETIWSLKKENEKLHRDRDFLRLDTGRLNDEIKEKDKEIEKLKNENKNLVESNYVLNDHINEYEFVIKESDKEKAKLKSDIERWNKSYAYLVEQNGVLEKKAEDSDACYRGRVVQCNELAEKVKRLADKIDELEHTIELKDKDLEEKDGYIKHLNEKIDKLEAPMFESNFFVNRLNKNLTKFDSKSSVPCSEAIKQLEKKVDDIPCIKNVKFIDQFDNDPKIPTPEKVWKDDTTIINYLCRGIKKNPPYNEIAEHMMRKYKALRNAGFDHDDAMSLIPMWSDE